MSPREMQYTTMNKLEDSFSSGMNLIVDQIRSDNYRGAETISHNLINVASHLDYPDGVLVGEVMEAMFGQIADVLGSYKIEDERKNNLTNTMLEGLQQITQALKHNDEVTIYRALRKMRHEATEMQFHCWETCKPTKRPTSDVRRLLMEE